MSRKELTEEELEEELEKAWKLQEAQKDSCGTPLPSSRESGVQKDNVIMKKK